MDGKEIEIKLELSNKEYKNLILKFKETAHFLKKRSRLMCIIHLYKRITMIEMIGAFVYE